MFDNSLCEEFEQYRNLREEGSIDPMEVIQIRNNGFLHLKSHMNKDILNQQFKMPRALRNEEYLAVLLSEELSEDNITRSPEGGSDIIHPAKLENLTAVPYVQDYNKETFETGNETEEKYQEEENEKGENLLDMRRLEEEEKDSDIERDVNLIQDEPLFSKLGEKRKSAELSDEVDELAAEMGKSQSDPENAEVMMKAKVIQNQEIQPEQAKVPEPEELTPKLEHKTSHSDEEETMNVLRQGNLGEKRKEKRKEIMEYQRDWLGDVNCGELENEAEEKERNNGIPKRLAWGCELWRTGK
jgi:hypothetical protein